MASDDLMALIAEQAELIGTLQAERAERETADYWEHLYTTIEDAMQDYCLAKTGLSRPDPNIVDDKDLSDLIRAVL